MRITGLATGLDMDQLVKETMQPYRIRIQQQQQQKEIIEIKQKLYRDVINDSRNFYNKYFDVTKSDSLLLSKNWTTTNFTSSNESLVSVTGSTTATARTYTVTGKAATAATATLDSTATDVTVNGKKFTLTGNTGLEKATNLNNALSAAGMNVKVRYTELAGTTTNNNKSGFIFESTILGANSTFTLGGTVTPVGTKASGVDGTAAKISGFTVDELKAINGSFKIGTTDIVLGDISGKSDDEIKTILNEKISASGLTTEISGMNITFSTKAVGAAVVDPVIDIGGNKGSFASGTDATKSTNTVDGTNVFGKVIVVNGKTVDMSKATVGNEVEYLNTVLKAQNAGVTAAINGSDVVFTSDVAGASKVVDVSVVTATGTTVTPGTDTDITIKDDKGGVYTHKGTSNTVTLDGVTFKFNGEIPTAGVTITGKNDITAVKDKLVAFVNDYNSYMTKLNTILTDSRDRSYLPLTDEQKESMSDDEIKLWNSKVEKGQLRRDSDVSRIASSMKQAMSSLVGGVSGNLETFGINPVPDYQGTTNGTFTIDETKLTAALENNLEDVMQMFIGTPDSSVAVADKYANTGVAQRLKSILYNETVTVASSIIKKAGIEGSGTAANNQLTLSIQAYERKMKDMEFDFSRREQALYSKWARVETMMNQLNSQQSYFQSQLGGM